MPKLTGQNLFLAVVVAGSLGLMAYLALTGDRGLTNHAEAGAGQQKIEDIPFNGTRAYEYLRQVCDIGRRISGTPGMAAQQQLLTDHFQKLGGQVSRQEFRARDPRDGSAVPMANLIVQWHPERRERILLCAHYDTRPFPDQDPVNPRGLFIGANDGGSGTALLMELAHDMRDLPGDLGVDFVLFDGEELVYRDGDPYFLGSEHFARTYVAEPPPYRYKAAVLLDMVGDADLQVFQEKNSVSWPETRPLVNDIWKTARRLGVREFIARTKHQVNDDHLALRNIARIPCCDVIDFDYPFWHTEQDVPERCSALSLAKVGWVIREWLGEAVRERPTKRN
jgi:glutaminyl-peptide cyclotransferase